eukprot:scaffold29365_cov73-Isochrysis_galbana.AAC.1
MAAHHCPGLAFPRPLWGSWLATPTGVECVPCAAGDLRAQSLCRPTSHPPFLFRPTSQPPLLPVPSSACITHPGGGLRACAPSFTFVARVLASA